MNNFKSVSLLLICILFLFNSCDDYCENTNYESYLPLKVGNKWTYDYHDNTQIWEVIGEREINGKFYYDVLVKYQDINGPILTHHDYYRFDNSKLYKYTVIFDSETLFADFSLSEGETFIQENSVYEVTVWSDTPNEFKFYYDFPGSEAANYAITFRIDTGILGVCLTPSGTCNYLVDYKMK